MQSYNDLEIFGSSFSLTLKVHELSLKLPKYELFEEGGQVRKSSKGITSCIVEGYGRRRYKAEFVTFLIYAHASCDETINHLFFLKETHPELENEIGPLIEAYNELGAKINSFTQYVSKNWK